ncbi:putative ribonuclease H-like domain-containing protein [Tanacetum coccineum]
MSGSQDDIPPPPPPPSQTPTQQTPHTVSTIKLPILKKGEYDIWAMKMEHYLAHTDYPIWEVIQNRNGPVSITTDTQGQIKVLPPRTAEDILARERERKARTTLLMALLEDHLAKFHKMTDAKEIWEAIKSRFGRNDKSKKMQKYILKQQFEGFSVSNSEGLHKGYDRSLPSAWSQVSLIMRTNPEVDNLSFDDLYNNLRVFENDVKGSTASSSSTQNVAFVSKNTSSTNDVSTGYSVSNTFGHNSQTKGNQDNRRRDAWNSGNKEGRRSGKQEDFKALVTIDGKGVDWTSQSEKEEDYALMACNSSGSDTKEPLPEPIINEPKVVSQPKVWSDAPIIEEYESDSEDEHVSLPTEEQETPSFANQQVKSPRETVMNQFTHSKNPIVDKKGDCDFHEKRMSKQAELNNRLKRNSSQREIRPIWNNVQRVNHINQFVPTTILTRTGKILVNTARASVSAVGGKGKLLLSPQQVVIGDNKDTTGIKSPNTMDYPHRTLQNKGIVDSGCSGHMTGNKAYLAKYQDFNGGPVSFGGSQEVNGKGCVVDAKKNSPNKHPDLKTDEKPVDKEDQVFLDELERLKRQEQDANDAAEALRKEFTQETEDLLLQAEAAKTSNDSEIPTLEDIYKNPTDGIFTNSSYDDEGSVADFTNLETVMNVSPIPTSRINSIYPSTLILRDPQSAVQTRSKVTKSSGAHAFILVDLPYGKKAIGTKWVYRNKKDERGVVVRNKARLVSQGHRQDEGIDYDEVFAPVARIEAIRISLAIASYMGFIVYQMDVKNAFLYGKIDEEVYVSQPPGFIDPKYPKKVYKVVKALYGLHQAPRVSYVTLSTFLLKHGYRRGTIDKTLFIKKDKHNIILVQVYVDDIIFGSTKKSCCDEFKALIKSRFQMSSMGELTFFLGVQVKQKVVSL